jgi:hypothetical protein
MLFKSLVIGGLRGGNNASNNTYYIINFVSYRCVKIGGEIDVLYNIMVGGLVING